MKTYTVVMIDYHDCACASIVVEVPDDMPSMAIGGLGLRAYVESNGGEYLGNTGEDEVGLQYVFEGRLVNVLAPGRHDNLVNGLEEIFGVDDDPFAMR